MNSTSSVKITLSNMTDTLYCTVDASRAADEEGDQATVGTIRAAIEKESLVADDHDSGRCCAATKNAKNTDLSRLEREIRAGAAEKFNKENETMEGLQMYWG